MGIFLWILGYKGLMIGDIPTVVDFDFDHDVKSLDLVRIDRRQEPSSTSKC